MFKKSNLYFIILLFFVFTLITSLLTSSIIFATEEGGTTGGGQTSSGVIVGGVGGGSGCDSDKNLGTAKTWGQDSLFFSHFKHSTIHNDLCLSQSSVLYNKKNGHFRPLM